MKYMLLIYGNEAAKQSREQGGRPSQMMAAYGAYTRGHAKGGRHGRRRAPAATNVGDDGAGRERQDQGA